MNMIIQTCRDAGKTLLVAAAALLFVAVAAAAEAQTVKVADLKAAFLANFSKFTEWPDDALPAGGGFTYCIVEDKAVAWALESILKGHPGDPQRPLSVRLVKIDPSIRSCQVVYNGQLGTRDAAQLLDILKGTSAFTVGDTEDFAASGGVAQFVLDNGRMRFSINLAAAQRARLVLSSKLLSLATIVKDAGQ
jgi:hypothetical protein